MLKAIDKWHKTRLGLFVFALVELGIAYSFASIAIDRGNVWYYLFTLVFLVGALQNAFKFIGSFIYGRHKANKA